MRLIISLAMIACVSGSQTHADIYSDTLKKSVIRFGYKNPNEYELKIDMDLAEIGQKLFESENLSFNSNMSCQTCHLDEFSSTDGLPNAIGVGGSGQGIARLNSNGAIVPRNVLPLWGRGLPEFDTFFWDGKVQDTAKGVISQFLNEAPSDDPLVVAAHLPIVEIREMVIDDPEFDQLYKKEQVEAGYGLFNEIITREQFNTDFISLAAHFETDVSDLNSKHIGEALAEHIKNKFKLRKTKLNQFIDGKIEFDKSEIQGGILFYGKGRCVKCHNGPVFSDLDFHSIPFPQLGFGKNGFGVDYGRYNVTDKASDIYKFRTPPLIEVANTGPYGHSGSLTSLNDAIIAHFDPLALINLEKYDALQRVTLFHNLQNANNKIQIPYLDELEVMQIKKFLETLSFIED